MTPEPPARCSPTPREDNLTHPGLSQISSTTSTPVAVARRPSPGLLARMRQLDSANNKARVVSSPVLGTDKIGRIPESQLRELDNFHRDLSIRVERRGRTWSNNTSSPLLLPQHTGNSVALSMEPESLPEVDSEHSSIISTSDHIVASDSEFSEDQRDTKHKYRLPELEKTITPSAVTSDTVTEVTEHSAQPSPPPTPPPKDTPPIVPESPAGQWKSTAEGGTDLETYLRNRGNSRTNSIYTLSRVSFTNQIQQLTSIKLPDAASLAYSIKAKQSSQSAGRALGEAATQIQSWIRKASEVLNGLDAEDDVEWAAAAGRDGLADVDVAITMFEDLINVYVGAIEELEAREDINTLAAHDLKFLVDQMEEIISRWANIKNTLNGVKEQVEIAMEWEELWNSVLGEIGQELEALNRLVFEMEERRHRTALAEGDPDSLDFGELETIVEEAPRNNTKAAARNRFSFTPAFGSNSPLLSPTSESKQEDSHLLALFARMQPLRASLDFLPMRLSAFDQRAEPTFPSACGELDARKDTLWNVWNKLESDAESLRRELGEDRWVHLFRSAGAKALTMWQSFHRTMRKLRRAFEEGADADYVQQKLRTYEEKKPHYPPAIERVLVIMEKGLKDRLTINGEILRLQADIRQKLNDLYADIQEMDAFLDDLQLNRGAHQLRDSISTILSMDHSLSSSINLDTPGSSPASSVVMSRKDSDHGGASPYARSKSRQTSFNSSTSKGPATSTPSKRQSHIPTPGSATTLPRKTTVSRSSAVESPLPKRHGAATPVGSRRVSAPSSAPSDNRPKWNGSANMNGTVVGHNFKPLSATTPSPHRKLSTPTPPRSLRSVSSHSAIPIPSPLSRTSFTSPPPSALTRPSSTTPAQQAAVHAMQSAGHAKRPSLGPHNSSPITPRRPPSSMGKGSRSSLQIPSTASSGRRSSALNHEDISPTERKAARPPSALAGKRTSMLPTPAGSRTVSNGRMSRAGDDADRPRWRP